MNTNTNKNKHLDTLVQEIKLGEAKDKQNRQFHLIEPINEYEPKESKTRGWFRGNLSGEWVRYHVINGCGPFNQVGEIIVLICFYQNIYPVSTSTCLGLRQICSITK